MPTADKRILIPPKIQCNIQADKSTLAQNPRGWYKNPYLRAAIICTLVFFVLSAASWVQWHEYREGNRRLRTVADKHKVTTVMIRELYPELAVPVGAYEKLVETVGLDSTLAVFHRQLEKMKSEESEKGN